MSAQPVQVSLPRSPAFLASNGRVVLVSDRGGSFLLWPWPGEPGPVRRAHGDGGPVAVVGDDFATAGGWDPTVTRWEATGTARFSAAPFDGRITGLCGQDDDLLVAGANRVPRPAASGQGDRVDLLAGEIVSLDRQGNATGIPLTTAGQIEALACGLGWLAVIDRGDSGHLRLMRDGEQHMLPLAQGPATALAATPATLLVADHAGVWSFNVGQGGRTAIAGFDADSPRVLHLLAVGRHVFGATSAGLVRWPDGTRFDRSGSRPAGLARHGESLLVLWEDGLLEQRDPARGAVMHAAQVPTE